MPRSNRAATATTAAATPATAAAAVTSTALVRIPTEAEMDASIAAAYAEDLNEGLALLREAGRAGAAAGKKKEEAETAAATAMDTTIAGLTVPGVMLVGFSFDVRDKSGTVVEHCAKVTLADYLIGFGANRLKETAFRNAMLPIFFNVHGNKSAAADSVWSTFRRAVKTAAVLLREGMTATLVDGKLVIDGGTSDLAKAMREATSTKAMVKAATGAAGVNGSKPDDIKKEEATPMRAATPAELTRTTLALVKVIASGEGCACNAAMSNLREIARLIALNPTAFADS